MLCVHRLRQEQDVPERRMIMKRCNWECNPSPPANIPVVYGGMFNHPGYSVKIDSLFEEKALLFDGQYPSTDKIILEAGSISMEGGYSFTPGTLFVNESGTYSIEYSINAASDMDAECRFSVYVDNALLLNSMTLLQMHPDNLYLFNRRTCYHLEAGSRIQLVVYASEAGSIIIGGNLSQLFVQKLSD